MRRLRGGLFSVLMLLVLAAPAALADATTASWTAKSSNGTASITTTAAGSGSVRLVLKVLPKKAAILVAIRRGTCTVIGAAVVNLPAARSTATGTLSATKPLTAAVVTKMRAATTLVVTIKAGTWQRCMPLKPATAAAVTFTDGTYHVGTDLKAGTYRTRQTPAAGEHCGWDRLRGFGDRSDDAIASRFSLGYSVVTIVATDAGFQSDGCGTWSSDLSRVTTSQTAFGEGTFIVNTDILPGTYRTRLALSVEQTCMWSRLRGFSGGSDDTRAIDLPNGYAVVTILESDTGFDSSECGAWSSDLSRVTASQTTFGEGTYIVNTDILPGTYRSSGASDCYWARLRGFTGVFEDYIDLRFGDSPATVTIAASDVGFTSRTCGTWTLQP
jgi:hypothetical protein